MPPASQVVLRNVLERNAQERPDEPCIAFEDGTVWVVPGLMDTPLAQTMLPANRQRLEANALFPQRFGRAEEFAALAVQIVENRYLNGTCLRLDAGLRMPVK